MKYREGGLMRCCIQSLLDAPPDPVEGDTFRCHWCYDDYGMVFRDGAWEAWEWGWRPSIAPDTRTVNDVLPRAGMPRHALDEIAVDAANERRRDQDRWGT